MVGRVAAGRGRLGRAIASWMRSPLRALGPLGRQVAPRLNAILRTAGLGCLVWVFWQLHPLGGVAAVGVVLILLSIDLRGGG